MVVSFAKTEQESFQRLGPPAPLDEDYWPMVRSAAMTALVALVSQFVIVVFLAVQWGIPVEVRSWNRVFPYLIFMTTSERFEALIHWSLLLSAVVLAIYSISAFLGGHRLQVQAGRLSGWLDIMLLGSTVLVRQNVWGHDTGASNVAWVLTPVGFIGFVVGMLVIRARFQRRRRLHGTHFSHLERRFV